MSKQILACCIGLFALVSSVVGQDIDPRGIYFNRFAGQFSGTEFFQVTSINGSTTQFAIRDIYGGGFIGTIDAAGTVVLPGEPMNGMFSDPDNFVIFPFDGAFTFTSNRIPTTTVDFPLILDSPRPANPLLNGQWNNTLRSINPETGRMSTPATEIITVTTTGNAVRITDPNGLFFQGVFEDGLTAGYRVVANPGFGTTTGIFASFPGSSTNVGQDLLGEMNMVSINEFRASFMLQTRTRLGNQNQVLFEFQATRVNPYAEGDANGDGVVDSADEMRVDDLQGTTFEDDNYDLAADINSDGVINLVDSNFYNTLGDVNQDGAVDFLDISPFILVLTTGEFIAQADIDQSGAVDFLDISPFIAILSAP